MSIRVVLLGSISLIAISVSTPAMTTGCKDDRFACEPQVAAEQTTAAPLSLQPAAASRKTASRRVHRAAKHAHASRKSRAVAKAAVRARLAAQDQEKAPPEANEFDKAPPENVLPQGTMSWMPLGAATTSNKATPFDAFDALATKPAIAASGDVRVVPADEVNEIDLSAPQVPTPAAAVQAETAPAAPVIENAVIEKPSKPADTALLDRIFLTFGGAFGAASAMRLFLKA